MIKSNKKYVYIILMLLLTLILACTVSAEEVSNTTITDSIDETSLVDNVQTTEDINEDISTDMSSKDTKNMDKLSAGEMPEIDLYVTDYRGLLRNINKELNSPNSQYSYTIFLDDGDYDIVNSNTNHSINWNNSASNVRNLSIIGNNQVINGLNTYAFMNIAKGYTVNIYNLTITNTSSGDGGAFYNCGNLSLHNVNFLTNYAKSYGSAIVNNKSSCNITDCYFEYNDGYYGTIANINATMISVNNTFKLNGADRGGAIYATDSSFNSTNDKFIDNVAYDGGAIYTTYAKYNINNDEFINNSANFGGVLYSTVANYTINNSIMTNSIAYRDGGVLYSTYSNSSFTNLIVDNSTANRTAGFYITDSKVNITKSSFRNTNASYQSGALSIFRSFLRLTNSEFINNTGAYGGALCSNSTTTNIQNVTFRDNKGKHSGAVYTLNYYDDGNETSIVNSTFINNTASNDGGAISIECTTTSITNTVFNDNKANVGGAIATIAPKQLKITNCSFTNNAALLYDGGAIYSVYSEIRMNNSCFINNTASIRGGAIALQLSGFKTYIGTLINTTLFDNNYAPKGAVSYSTWSKAKYNSNVFVGEDDTNYFYSDEDLNLTLDDNWWGMNNPDFKCITNNITPNSWIVMDYLNNNNNIRVNLTSLNNGNKSKSILPARNITFTADAGTFSIANTTITSYVNSTYSGSSENIYATIDRQTLKLTEKLEPYLTSNDYKASVNEDVDITVQVNDDATGEISVYVDGNLINTLDASKITNFAFTVPTSFVGNYEILVTYSGNNKYQTKNVTYTLYVKNDSITYEVIPTNNPGLNNFTVDELPSAYDLRNLSLITSVKDQAESGSCWAFGSIASLESALMKIYGGYYDFSENNMKNLLKYYGKYGSDDDPTSGGTVFETVDYYITWLGVINDIDDPYDDHSLFSVEDEPVYKVTDIYLLDERKNSTDNELIKRALLQYGALFASYDHESTFINSANGAYYNYAYTTANHLICVAGWDDNYSKENFLNEPAGDGAFIIKNSWNTNYGDDGYIYISYYDKSIQEFGAFIINNTNNYTKLYQYDMIGENFYNNTPSVWVKNVYTAQRDEILSAIGTYILDKTEYEAKIYINDELVHTQNGYLNLTGYMTIPLTKYFKLDKDDVFTVEMKFTAQDNNTFVLLQQDGDFRLTYEANRSFISTNGNTWKDLYNNTTKSVACLKAYTTDYIDINTIVDMNNSLNIQTITNKVNEDANVSYMINDEILKDENDNDIVIALNNNMAKLEYNMDNLENGNYTLTTILTTYNSIIKQNKTIEIIKQTKDVYLVINVIDDTINNTIISVSAFDNKTNEKITNMSLIVRIDNNLTASVKTDQEFLFNLLSGEHEIVAYTNDDNYTPNNESITIIINKHKPTVQISVESVKYASENTITATLYDENNNPIAQRDVNLTLNNQTIPLTSNDEGVVTYVFEATTIGLNNVSVTIDDELYEKYTANNSFDVYKLDTNITLDSISTVTIGESVTVSGLLSNEIDQLKNANITIRINDLDYITSTDNEARFNLIHITNKTGTNDVAILYNGDIINNPTNIMGTFTVNKLKTSITLNPIVFVKVGQNTTISGYLKDNNSNVINNANITLNVDDITQLLKTNDEGLFTYNYQTTKTGPINTTITYNGDDTYLASNATKTFNVNKIKTYIKIDPIKYVKVGQNTTISGQITDEFRNPVENALINIKVNNTSVNYRSTRNGTFIYEYPTRGTGLIEAIVTYNGNDTYINSTNNKTFTVNKLNTYIKINPIKYVKVGQNTTISGQITDEYKNKVINVPVTISINNTNAEIFTDNNGTFTYNYQTTIAGLLVAKVTYDGDYTYINSTNNKTFTVNKVNTFINANPIAYVRVGSNTIISGVLVDEYRNKLADTNLTFILNNDTFTITTDANGTFNYTYTTTTVGVNNLTIRYDGTDILNAKELVKNFKVNKHDAYLKINSFNYPKIDGNLTITGSITDDNKTPLANTDIILSFNGENVYLKTDADGLYQYTYHATKLGANNLTLIYEGSDTINARNTTKTFTVKKHDVYIKMNSIKYVKVGNNTTIAGTLTDETGAILSDTNLTLSFNGENVTIKTDANGKFKYLYPSNKVESVNLTYYYAGDATHNSKIAYKTFEVTKHTTYIKLNSIKNVSVGQNVSIRATVVDETGSALINAKLQLNINGEIVNITTNSSGMFNYSYKTTTTGANNLTITYDATENYKAAIATKVFNVL